MLTKRALCGGCLLLGVFGSSLPSSQRCLRLWIKSSVIGSALHWSSLTSRCPTVVFSPLSCTEIQPPFSPGSNNASIRSRTTQCQSRALACIYTAEKHTQRIHSHTALQHQMDGKQGCSQVQITFCSWVIQSHHWEREGGAPGLGPGVSVFAVWHCITPSKVFVLGLNFGLASRS